ncbi:hypothetical protein [Brevundimonas sp.]|jgi:hypothetical protein|uniref:hypothetical protein n=1 Tax=Brevundimonas sp. TaxID=1871086 RepID=UPI00391A69E8
MTDAIVWPETWIAAELRVRYADLGSLDDAALARHYEDFGRREGRIASPAAQREGLIALVPADASILEIGPFCQPVLTGPNVRYLDVLDAASLRVRGEAIGIDTSRTPETIHFTNGLGEAAGQDLDILFSSHNLEHQPDLIGHLKEAAAALALGGVYVLIVPDRRYCFDHFLPDLTVARVLDAHLEARTVHTAQSVIEHRAFTCHNDTLRHWHGDHGPEPDGMDGRIDYALNELKAANGGYVDVHAWQFTPQSFESVMTTLNRLGWSPFRPLRVYDTAYGRNEFTAVLTLDAAA